MGVAQVLQGMLAVLMAGLLALGFNRAVFQNEYKMIVNETTTGLVSAGEAVLEHIGSTAFDEKTNESKLPKPISYPVVTSTGDLTTQAKFGTADDPSKGACTSFKDAGCDDIDDFDGVSDTLTTGKIKPDDPNSDAVFYYQVQVNVQYVDPVTHVSTGGTPSWAKEVEVVLTNPFLRVGGSPFQVRLYRVFTYQRFTS